MKKLLLVLAVLGFVLMPLCFAFSADANYGVSVEERVINLPQDQTKWYISVVGNRDNSQYRTILGWFDSHAKLTDLRRQVHFCPIVAGSPTYEERYGPNVLGLPTVRLQDSDGVVVYEAAGRGLPFSADGLYGALASAVIKASGTKDGCPWRRNCPTPEPTPTPTPVPDPEPVPIDDGGAPVVDEPTDTGVASIVWLSVLGFLGGAGVGVVSQWKKTYSQK